ncbi:unnamed protein product [Arctogadus glacialis]
MWMTSVLALCLLAPLASADDRKLSSHATLLADNSADLAFSLYHNMAQDKGTGTTSWCPPWWLPPPWGCWPWGARPPPPPRPLRADVRGERCQDMKHHLENQQPPINLTDKKSAVNSINEWAAASTNGKLPEVTKDVPNADGAMLINAIVLQTSLGRDVP